MSWTYFVIIGVILTVIFLIFSAIQKDKYLANSKKAEKLANARIKAARKAAAAEKAAAGAQAEA